MQIGIVGLGRMGAGMARRLARAGVRVVCYDQAEAARKAIAGEPGVGCAENLAALCARMEGERIIVLMLPAGAAVEDTIRSLTPMIATGDTLVDGGNSYYRDSMRRALALSQQGLRYIDAGISGGVHGLEQGYCLMLGGTPKSIEIFQPFACLLAPEPERGWLHCGPSGAGHFAKMIHNGIEYGIMQSLAEGFALLAARPELDIDPARLAETWRRRARARHHPGADEPLLQSGRVRLCAQAARHDARRLRRTPRTKGAVIVIVMGVSGVGKTTIGEALAREMGGRFLDADDFHPPQNVAKVAAGQPLEDEDRSPWLEKLNSILKSEENAVLACSALKERYRRRLTEGIPRVEWVYLKGEFTLIHSRMAQRRHRYMPATLLQSQFDALEPPRGAITVDVGRRCCGLRRRDHGTAQELEVRKIENIPLFMGCPDTTSRAGQRASLQPLPCAPTTCDRRS